ncbi:MAG: hypothetical protein U5K71_08535 [Gracilimonas sp.]|nr:hypothetical protein [Gracilimonas sp.]
MHNTDDHKAIRYLMKEMDPSEELEFEKQMREDEDLLIEVESLRATNKKLSALPDQNPPEHLIDNISQQAEQAAQRNSGFTFKNIIVRGAAAAFLLASLAGGYIYYSPVTAVESGSTNIANDRTVEPWVDRNDILRYAGEVPNTAESETTMHPDLLKSYDKLQLVSEPMGNTGSSKRILLTGSSN